MNHASSFGQMPYLCIFAKNITINGVECLFQSKEKANVDILLINVAMPRICYFSTIMFLLHEVCGRQIGSCIADCSLLKIQKLDLDHLFQIFLK